jgi:hypothetical protein
LIQIDKLKYLSGGAARRKGGNKRDDPRLLASVAIEMHLDALRQETFAALATATIENSTTVLGLHPGAETKLFFASAFGRLIAGFHDLGAVRNGLKRIARIEEEW